MHVSTQSYEPVATASRMHYDSDSNESLHNYGRDYGGPSSAIVEPQQTPSMYTSTEQLFYSPGRQIGRRHSSYSHEDILKIQHQQQQMQRQPQIDPRYRDSRPFVKSSSNLYEYNGKRDFFSRRRSSSSLQEDVLQPFQQQLQQQYNATLARTGWIRSGGGSGDGTPERQTSKWDLTPSIFVEEYQDTVECPNEMTAKSNHSSTGNLSINIIIEPPSPPKPIELPVPSKIIDKPLKPNVPLIVDDIDKIPFIDDEFVDNSSFSDQPLPVYVPNRYGLTGKASAVVKNRKTVSFDLMESADDDDADKINSPIRKSSTCEYINYYNDRTDNSKAETNSSDDHAEDYSVDTSIFKFCKIPNKTVNKSFNNNSVSYENVSADSDDNEVGSTYFYTSNNENNRRTTSHVLRPIVDAKSLELDLSELLQSSESSGTSTNTNTIPTTTTTTTTDENDRQQQMSTVHEESTSTNSSGASDRMPLPTDAGCPKQASWMPSNFYQRLTTGPGKVQFLRNYFENLRATERKRQMHQSSPDIFDETADRLSSTEQMSIIRQLDEWSRFGTRPRETMVVKNRTGSVSNLIGNSNADCCLCRDDDTDERSKMLAEKCTSVPDVSHYALTEITSERKKFPDAYIVRKQNAGSLRRTHVSEQCIPAMFYEPTRTVHVVDAPATTIHSPCHRSRFQTLRNIKNIQMRKRLFGSGGRTSGRLLGSDMDAAEDEEGR